MVWAALAGMASVVAGAATASVALLAFGLDSVIDGSSSGVLVWRVRRELHRAGRPGHFDQAPLFPAVPAGAAVSASRTNQKPGFLTRWVLQRGTKRLAPKDSMAARMFDADEHYYETDDAFTRYLPKKFLDENRAVRVVRTADRPEGRLFFGDKKITFFGVNPVEATGRPGQLLAYFKSGGGTGNAVTGKVKADDIPESRNRSLRLKWMADQGVTGTLMFPTSAVGVEYQLQGPPAQHRAPGRRESRGTERPRHRRCPTGRAPGR